MGASRARILIAGGAGQLGRALAARLDPDRVTVPPEAELDITSPESLRAAVGACRPDWIVNCAAYTAVDAAEKEPEKAFLVNDVAVGHLADAALEGGARLLHISTDYVFDGSKAGLYVEDDPTGPINVYGASKLAGEVRLRAHPVRSAILRTAWLYGEGPRNFLRWALESGRKALASGEPLPVVDDQAGSPTDVHTLSAQIVEAIEADLRGTFHAVAEGSTTWLGFAREIFRQAGLAVALRPIRGEELKRAARRAARIVLEDRALKAIGRCRMVDWKEGLRTALGRMEG